VDWSATLALQYTGEYHQGERVMNRNYGVRALWQSFMSAILAGSIYTIIYAVTSKGLNGFIEGALVIAGITFVVALLLHILFSMLFGRRGSATVANVVQGLRESKNSLTPAVPSDSNTLSNVLPTMAISLLLTR
jgi:amino acid transporter